MFRYCRLLKIRQSATCHWIKHLWIIYFDRWQIYFRPTPVPQLKQTVIPCAEHDIINKIIRWVSLIFHYFSALRITSDDFRKVTVSKLFDGFVFRSAHFAWVFNLRAQKDGNFHGMYLYRHACHLCLVIHRRVKYFGAIFIAIESDCISLRIDVRRIVKVQTWIIQPLYFRWPEKNSLLGKMRYT